MPSVDLAPVLVLLAIAGAVAAVPLLWLSLRWRGAGPAARLRMLVGWTVFLTLDLIVVGAFTRLTDSGLGCPDWPGCYGKATPWGAAAQIAHEEAVLPSGPVTRSKAWIEMVHRYFASAVGALIVATAALRWRWRRQLSLPGLTQPAGTGMPWALLVVVAVCLQGAFGALTVTMKLWPAIVTAHLLGALLLAALLRVQWAAYENVARASAAAGSGDAPGEPASSSVGSRLPQGLRGLVWATLVVVLVQAALGAWVSSNYAVLACSEIPHCHSGLWWPSADFSAGFEIWRPLGQTAAGQALPSEALVAIHLTHRCFALLVLIAVLGLCWRLRQLGSRDHVRTAQFLVALLAWQVLTGLGNVALGWPLLAALMHTAGAAGLVLVLVEAGVRA